MPAKLQSQFPTLAASHEVQWRMRDSLMGNVVMVRGRSAGENTTTTLNTVAHRTQRTATEQEPKDYTASSGT